MSRCDTCVGARSCPWRFVMGWGIAAACVTFGLSGCAAEPVTCRASPDSELHERLGLHVQREAASGFSGAVLVVDGDRVVLDAEYPAGAGPQGGHRYWIASISKAITAVAAMRLVEEGRLDLHAPIGTYLTDVPVRWSGVTAHHLLSHRSGLPHSYAADGIADRHLAARAILAQAPVNAPGEFEYSNDGYNLLAILVEVRSGEPFESYVRRTVFAPAGMGSRASGVTNRTPPRSHPSAARHVPIRRPTASGATVGRSPTGDIAGPPASIRRPAT